MKNKIKIFTLFSLASNVIFFIYNIAIGILYQSWWMLTIGTYYVLLSIMRAFVIKSKSDGCFIKRVSGIMLILTVAPLIGTVILASIKDRGIRFQLIMMLSVAVYSFSKIVIAIVNLAKLSKVKSAKTVVLRNISFADALVSILSLQRSMLASFEGMSEEGIRNMNIATGSGVCLLIFILGMNMLLYAKKLDKTE